MSTHTKYISGNLNSKYGLIINYLDVNKIYFRFTINSIGEYYLSQITNLRNDIILSGKYDVNNISQSVEYDLKVRYVDTWIIIHINDKPLEAWDSKKKLIGKCGVYVDADITVKFSDFNIQPVKSNF